MRRRRSVGSYNFKFKSGFGDIIEAEVGRAAPGGPEVCVETYIPKVWTEREYYVRVSIQRRSVALHGISFRGAPNWRFRGGARERKRRKERRWASRRRSKGGHDYRSSSIPGSILLSWVMYLTLEYN